MGSQKGRSITRILVADDDGDFRFTTTQILESQGYDCVPASSADEALAKLEESHFDLLIADINMPGNEDLSLLDFIQQNLPGIPMILVTGTPSVDTAVKAVGLNVCSYLIKPFDIAKFLADVEKAVILSMLRNSIDDSMSGFLRITNQLAELREQLALARPDINGASSNFINVLVAGLVDSLSNSVQLINRIEDKSNAPYAAAPYDKGNPDTEMLITAIRETIDTLEKTKRSFKSKELGQLRKKLNIALQVIDSPALVTQQVVEPEEAV